MPAPEFKNYDPAQQVLQFRGVQITGLATGSHITAARDSDSFTKVKGALGDTTRVRNRDKGGRITFTTMREAPINAVLSAFLKADEESGGGYGTATLEDLNGDTLLESPNAWLMRLPDHETSTDPTNIEWVLDCDELIGDIGGAVA